MKLFDVWKGCYPVYAADVVEAKVDQIHSRTVLLIDAQKFTLKAKRSFNNVITTYCVV